MKLHPFIVLLTAIVGLSARPLRADETWGKAADNKIYAQKLVNDVLARHPDLIVLALHAIAPGAKDETIVAADLDRIGKKDDDDDLSVANEHRIVLAPNPTDPGKYEVLVPLRDASGRIIGEIGNVFKYHPGDPEMGLLRRALAIRDELAAQIPELAALFKPAM